MRKILITARLVLVSLFANASHQSSQLYLTVAQNRIFAVSIDRLPFSSQGSSFTIDHLEPGYHELRVISYWKSPHRYSLHEEMFRNSIYIPPASRITGSIGLNHSFEVCSIVPVCPQLFPYHANNRNSFYETMPSPYPTVPMGAYDFERLKNAIASRAFESSKLEIARQGISSNHLLTTQVSELIQQMNFESSRLEIAKFAYRHTIDTQNYYLINDAFNFESSIRELNKFINSIS